MKPEKSKYAEPQIEIIQFETKDVIATSGSINLPLDPINKTITKI